MSMLQTPQASDSAAQPAPVVERARMVTITPPRKYRDATTISPLQRSLTYALLLVGSSAFLLPFYFIVNGSLKTNSQVQSGNFTALPKQWADVKWSNYPEALAPDRMNFLPAFANTVVVTTLCVVGQIISCSLVGFGFARFRFRGRSIVFLIMLSTMMLPAQVTMIPVFILFRYLGMIDSFWPLVIPAWLASPFFVFMFRQFFTQIPEELVEAARIDGASHWRVYWQLMLPLSGPVIAIVAIYTFLGAWNDFMGPLIYLNSNGNRTLALALNGFKGQFGALEAHHLMAASVVCMLPCVVLFFAAQKYFVESVATTGLKG